MWAFQPSFLAADLAELTPAMEVFLVSWAMITSAAELVAAVFSKVFQELALAESIAHMPFAFHQDSRMPQ